MSSQKLQHSFVTFWKHSKPTKLLLLPQLPSSFKLGTLRSTQRWQWLLTSSLSYLLSLHCLPWRRHASFTVPTPVFALTSILLLHEQHSIKLNQPKNDMKMKCPSAANTFTTTQRASQQSLLQGHTTKVSTFLSAVMTMLTWYLSEKKMNGLRRQFWTQPPRGLNKKGPSVRVIITFVIRTAKMHLQHFHAGWTFLDVMTFRSHYLSVNRLVRICSERAASRATYGDVMKRLSMERTNGV